MHNERNERENEIQMRSTNEKYKGKYQGKKLRKRMRARVKRERGQDFSSHIYIFQCSDSW